MRNMNVASPAKLIRRERLLPAGYIFIFAFLLAGMLILNGCQSGRSVSLGQNNTGTITSSDPTEGETENDKWSYHVYTLDVEAGYPYRFSLSTLSDGTLGIWSEDKGSWIVEVSPVVTTRTATYTFQHGGKQKLYVEVPTADVPSEYSWSVTR